MDQAGSRRATRRTRRRGTRAVLWVSLLALLGVLAACGGSDDGVEADDREAGPAEESEAAAASTTTTTAPSTTTTAPAPPRVVYEIDGTGTVNVNYGLSGGRSQSRNVTLPWSEEQAEEPSQLSMLVALGGSQGDVTCRIRRGEEVLAEQTFSLDAGPLLSCDYPPSGLPPVTYPPGL
jgi:hypothetical protein